MRAQWPTPVGTPPAGRAAPVTFSPADFDRGFG